MSCGLPRFSPEPFIYNDACSGILLGIDLCAQKMIKDHLGCQRSVPRPCHYKQPNKVNGLITDLYRLSHGVF